MKEVIEYYYSWKKYCSEEYRGRNRHTSEEVGHALCIYTRNTIMHVLYKVMVHMYNVCSNNLHVCRVLQSCIIMPFSMRLHPNMLSTVLA